MLTSTFWRDALERCLRTAAQALLGVLTVAGVTVLDVDWQQAGAVAVTAALVSLLMSVVASGVGTPGTASVLPEIEYGNEP